MKIVYGVSGEGLGHVFEAIEIARILKESGHEVMILTYGDRAMEKLAALNPTRIGGVTLEMSTNGLSFWKTVWKNLDLVPFYVNHFGSLRRDIAEFRPDVFISAFEPFTNVMSRVFRKPLISLDNQNELLLVKKPPGASEFDFILAQWATRICTYGAAHYVVRTFDKKKPFPKNVTAVFPIVQQELQAMKPSRGEHVFVYLTKPNPELLEILKFRPESFIVYCHDRVGEDGNIIFRKSGPTYLPDLASAKAVIANTGFSLIGDAFYLKKPMFGVPVRKQFEQIYNAYVLQQSGLGTSTENPTRALVDGFFENLESYAEKLQHYRFDPSEEGDAILKIIRNIEKPL